MKGRVTRYGAADIAYRIFGGRRPFRRHDSGSMPAGFEQEILTGEPERIDALPGHQPLAAPIVENGASRRSAEEVAERAERLAAQAAKDGAIALSQMLAVDSR